MVPNRYSFAGKNKMSSLIFGFAFISRLTMLLIAGLLAPSDEYTTNLERDSHCRVEFGK